MTIPRSGRRALVLSLLAFQPLVAQKGPLANLDDQAAVAMREFQIPGLAIAVVKDGRIVAAEGYGVRTLGRNDHVTANTLFQVASNSKAVTTAALAMLVDEGKLAWDDRVIDHLPWFRLYDPYVTREFTVRDLLTHRSGLGLGAGDLLWYRSPRPGREVVERLRVVPPVSSFRTAYAYDNVLYVAAGLIIEEVSGMSWHDFVRDRIFAPLGMSSTSSTIAALTAAADAATPHSRFQADLRIVPRDTVDNVAPAAALNTSAADWAKWMIVQLDSGRVRPESIPNASEGSRQDQNDGSRAQAKGEESRLWSEQRAREMWTGVTIQPIGSPPAGLPQYRPNFAEYALGWGLRDYRGYKIVTHTGGLSGMTSRTLLVPDLKLGIAVFTNSESAAHTALSWWILDRYLDAPRTDWVGILAANEERNRARAADVERKALAERAADTRPSLPLEKYAQPYIDALYGDATITREDDGLVLRFAHSPQFVADLEHWHYDTFVAHWRERTIPDAYVTFRLDARGAIEGFEMEAVSPLADFSFDYQDLHFRPKE